jgi:F0F1-type ATP synthase membrane subunit b/b'
MKIEKGINIGCNMYYVGILFCLRFWKIINFVLFIWLRNYLYYNIIIKTWNK